MSGTKNGGLKAAATNKAIYGDDFYRRIGQKGGQLGTTGGFYANRQLASVAGAKGGRISRRQPKTSLEQRRALVEFQEGFNQPSAFDKFRKKILGFRNA